jgi:hypothetical protein
MTCRPLRFNPILAVAQVAGQALALPFPRQSSSPGAFANLHNRGYGHNHGYFALKFL